MFEVSDIAIILICGATCLYCFILGRRLTALQNTKDGLGAAITTFSKSVADVSSAARSTTVQASELAVRLASLIEEANTVCKRAKTLTENLDVKRDDIVADLNATQSALSKLMTHAQSLQAPVHAPREPAASVTANTSSEDLLTASLTQSLGQELRDRTDRMKHLIQNDVL